MLYSADAMSKTDLIVHTNISDTTVPSARGHREDEEYTPTLITVVAMLSIFSVVGVVGNAIAFYIFFRRRNSSTSVVFILALAGTDFITCLITIPYTIAHELLRYRLVYDLACKTYIFLITSTVPFSAYIMVGIALDRYFCICHPFLYLVTIPRAKVIIAGMGIPALTFGTMTALMYGTYIYQEKTVANVTTLFNVSGNPLTNSEIIDILYNQIERHPPPSPDLTLEGIYIMADKSSPSKYAMVRYIEHHKNCVMNNFVFNDSFVSVYTKIHAAGFVLAYVIVAILYILIYKSIYTRRANKAKRKKNDMYPPMTAGTKIEETQMSVLNANGNHHQPNGQTNTLNNHHKMPTDQMGTRKIILTARNDAGLHPAHPAKNVSDMERKDSDGDCQKTRNDIHPSKKDSIPDKDSANMNISSDEDPCRKNSDNSSSGQDSLKWIDKHGKRPSCNVTSNPNLTSSINDNDDDEKSDDEREECSNVPLLKHAESAPTEDDNVLSQSNNFLSTSQTPLPIGSPPHPLNSNTTLNSTLPSTHDLSRSCPSLSPASENSNNPNNSTSVVTKDANNKIPSSHLSTSASVSPAVSPPTSLPIKITFSSCKPSDGPSSTKPKPKHVQTDAQTNSIKRKRQSTLRHRNLVANIKTAFMLFIVTLVFLIAFLPALLMANNAIPINLIFFYMYHIYNVANPFIYAFMNQTFREDLKKILNVFCSR